MFGLTWVASKSRAQYVSRERHVVPSAVQLQTDAVKHVITACDHTHISLNVFGPKREAIQARSIYGASERMQLLNRITATESHGRH